MSAARWQTLSCTRPQVAVLSASRGLIAWARSDCVSQAFLFLQTPQTPRIDMNLIKIPTMSQRLRLRWPTKLACSTHHHVSVTEWLVSLPSGRFSVGQIFCRPRSTNSPATSFHVDVCASDRCPDRCDTPSPHHASTNKPRIWALDRTQRRDEWEQKMFVRLFREQFSVLV
jgi:hypothetical protein